MQLKDHTRDTAARPLGIPMTADVRRRLDVEADRLSDHLPRLQAAAQEHGVSGDPEAPTVLAAGALHLATRRLESLRRMIAHGYVVEQDGVAIVGSRVTVRYPDGEEEAYKLVAPGEADARLGRISPDSPLGAALLGRSAGEVAKMNTPAGPQDFTILDVA